MKMFCTCIQISAGDKTGRIRRRQLSRIRGQSAFTDRLLLLFCSSQWLHCFVHLCLRFPLSKISPFKTKLSVNIKNEMTIKWKKKNPTKLDKPLFGFFFFYIFTYSLSQALQTYSCVVWRAWFHPPSRPASSLIRACEDVWVCFFTNLS